MELLWCVIATILSPVKGAQKIMMKILACLDFMDIFGFGVKELGDAAVLKTVEKHKWFGKVVGFCCWTIMTGGIFLYVMVIIWCFKLIIKLFKSYYIIVFRYFTYYLESIHETQPITCYSLYFYNILRFY